MVESKAFSSTGIQATTKYNPHLWGPEELKAIFVVRQKELKQLTEALRDTEPGYSPQHILIIGQRGMGKTTLLQRMALQVEENERLSNEWLPLRFPEEQYTVSHLAELWGNVLSALADALEAKGQSTLMLDQQLMSLETLPKDQREIQYLELINQWCEHNQKRLLLLIDSTDLLFDNLSVAQKGKKQDGGSPNLWSLRKTLQQNSYLFWLGGSYQTLESHDLYHDAFQNFFDLIELKPLTYEETQQAMIAMTQNFGLGRHLKGKAAEEEIEKILTERPERLKTLLHLTGGNPRTAVMLFELFATGGSDQVRNDLERLLDLMTPLYKARFEALAEQPRKLLAHIMERWQPISLGELSQTSGLENTRVSPQLIRLEKEGLIHKVDLPHTSRAGYQVSERFFNIWYLMRNAPRRLKLRLAWLVEFMRLWYSPEELEQIARQRIDRHEKGRSLLEDLEYSRAVASAMPCDNQIRLSLDYQIYKELQEQKRKISEFFDFEGDDKPFQSAEEYHQRFENLRIQLMQNPFANSLKEKKEFCEAVLISMNFTLDQKEKIAFQLSESSYHESIELLNEENHNYEKLLGSRNIFLLKEQVLPLNFYLDLPDMNIALIQIKQCFADNATLLWHFSKQHWNRFQDDAIDELIVMGLEMPIDPDYPNYLKNMGSLLSSRYATTHVQEAFEGWRQRYLKEAVFGEFYNLGCLYHEYLKDFDEADAAYKKAIELNKNYAHPWNNLANLYKDHLDRFKEAEEAYQQAIELDKNYAHPWNNLANLYKDHLGRFAEAEEAYKKAIELDKNNAFFWNNLGMLYRNHLGRFVEAEKAYQQAIELDKNYAHPWNGLGNLYQYHLDRFAEAEEAYRQAIELDKNFAYPWNGLGNLYQGHLGRFAEAEEAYKKAIELDKNNAFFWNNLGMLYRNHLGRFAEAEEAYKKAIELDKNITSPWHGLGDLYQDHLGRFAEAEEVYRQAIEINDRDPYSYCNLGRLHGKQRSDDQAIEQYRKALEVTDSNPKPQMLLQCHLWLNNTDFANQALIQLAQRAAQGDSFMFFSIKEQCWECQQIGRGLDLADLMASNPYAEFLKPFELALRYVNGDRETIKGAPLEIQQLAEEIVHEIELRL